MRFKVRWNIKLEKEVEADSIDDAVNQVENLDCQHDGEYVEDSFEIIKTELIEAS